MYLSFPERRFARSDAIERGFEFDLTTESIHLFIEGEKDGKKRAWRSRETRRVATRYRLHQWRRQMWLNPAWNIIVSELFISCLRKGIIADTGGVIKAMMLSRLIRFYQRKKRLLIWRALNVRSWSGLLCSLSMFVKETQTDEWKRLPLIQYCRR